MIYVEKSFKLFLLFNVIVCFLFVVVVVVFVLFLFCF